MKTRLLYICLLFAFTAQAGSIEELKSMLSKAKNPYQQPAELTNLMIELKPYETNPLPDQDSLMLEIYKTVSSTFLAYSHYKQGYQVFNRYLEYKENMLSVNKSKALNGSMNSVGERSRNDQTELVQLQNKLSGLKEENDILSHKLVLYKSNFSLTMIILSIVFAVILVGYGIRVFSLRSRLNHNRGTMKNIHKLALTGRYETGVRNALESSMRDVEKELAEIKMRMKN